MIISWLLLLFLWSCPQATATPINEDSESHNKVLTSGGRINSATKADVVYVSTFRFLLCHATGNFNTLS